MKKTDSSIDTARKIILRSQCLDSTEGPYTGKQGVLNLLKKLGYIQIDTLAVVSRSHHHTLWTRMDSYNGSMLDDLQSKDRAVF